MIAPPRLILLLALLASTAAAQIGGVGKDGAFTPTANITLITGPNGGHFHFTKISIPKGVTVTLRGSNPAVMYCKGTVDIAGILDAGGDVTWSPTSPFYWASSAPGPGGHPGGTRGSPGFGGTKQWYLSSPTWTGLYRPSHHQYTPPRHTLPQAGRCHRPRVANA